MSRNWTGGRQSGIEDSAVFVWYVNLSSLSFGRLSIVRVQSL